MENQTISYSSDIKDLSLLAKAVYICQVLARLDIENIDDLIYVHNAATQEDIEKAVMELEDKGLLKKPITIN